MNRGEITLLQLNNLPQNFKDKLNLTIDDINSVAIFVSAEELEQTLDQLPPTNSLRKIITNKLFLMNNS